MDRDAPEKAGPPRTDTKPTVPARPNASAEDTRSLAGPSDAQRPPPQEPQAAPEVPPDRSQPTPALSASEIPDPQVARVSREEPDRYETRYLEGQGGQARVLNVLDHHLGRCVALKELNDAPDAASARQAERRFLLEARVAGRLEHPNIVPVHELGRRPDGRLYYTMRLVHGETLSAKLKAARTLAERLAYLGAFWDTCKAIAYAHSHGVIHRDLKPANVMLGRYGETVLLDWGLAKIKDAPEEHVSQPSPLPSGTGEDLTGSGQAMGTPSYMSPEQARGEEVDERTDVWGLGAVLYRLLTGEAPYGSGANEVRIARAMFGGVKPVLARCPDAPPELAAIAHKALQRDKRDRYQSALEIAEEIRAYMTGGRVRAYTYSTWDLMRRFAADHRGAVVGSAVALLAVVGALVAVTVALGIQTRARAQEQRERLVAEHNLAGAYAERADRLLADFRYASASGFAALSLKHNPARDRPGSPRVDLPGGRDLLVRATSVAVQARGHFAFSPIRSLRAEEALGALAWSPDGNLLAAGSYDGPARVWNVQTGEPLMRLQSDELTTYATVYSPDGKLLATSGKKGHLFLWTPDGRRVADLAGHEGPVRGLVFSPDGKRLASGGADRTVRVWDVATGSELAVLRGHEAEVRTVAFSPSGKRLYSGGVDRSLRVWNPEEATAGYTLATFAFSVRAIALSPEGSRLAVACDEPLVTVLDSRTGAPDLVLTGNQSFVRQVAWSPDGALLASAGLDRTVRLWSTSSGEPVATLEEHGAIVSGVGFSPDGTRLASAAFDGTVRVWQVGRPAMISLAAGGSPLLGVNFSADGRRLATAGRDGVVRVWDLVTRKQVHAFHGEAEIDPRVRFGPKDLLVAAGGAVELWDAKAGKLAVRLPLKRATAARLSQAGDVLATGEDAGQVALWDLSGRPLRTFAGHASTVFDVVFSHDGSILASGGKDGKVRLWDVATGALRLEIDAHAGWVTALDFARDGRVVSAGKEGRVSVWDSSTGRELVAMAHPQWSSARFVGADAAYVATACDDQNVRFWDARTGELKLLVRTARELVSMDVTRDGSALAVNVGGGFSVYPVDLAKLDVDPEALLAEARSRGFAELPGAELPGWDPAETHEPPAP